MGGGEYSPVRFMYDMLLQHLYYEKYLVYMLALWPSTTDTVAYLVALSPHRKLSFWKSQLNSHMVAHLVRVHCDFLSLSFTFLFSLFFIWQSIFMCVKDIFLHSHLWLWSVWWSTIFQCLSYMEYLFQTHTIAISRIVTIDNISSQIFSYSKAYLQLLLYHWGYSNHVLLPFFVQNAVYWWYTTNMHAAVLYNSAHLCGLFLIELV